jgi:hypothetical protein
MRKFSLIVFSSICLIQLGCQQQAPSTEDKFQMKPIADVYELMESLVAHMAQEIFDSVRIEIDDKGTHEYKPETDEQWDEIGFAAKGLAETANLLMMEGRAEDQGNWRKHSQKLIDTSLQVYKAAQDHNSDALLEAGGYVYESCTECHNEYLMTFEMRRKGTKPGEAPSTAPSKAPK